MNTLTINPKQSVVGKGRASTGRIGVRSIMETIRISEQAMKPIAGAEGWTDEEFADDLKNAGMKTMLRDAIREAREDYREGRVKPFPER